MKKNLKQGCLHFGGGKKNPCVSANLSAIIVPVWVRSGNVAFVLFGLCDDTLCAANYVAL